MEKLVRNILDALRNAPELDAAALDRIIRQRSSEARDGRRIFAKKRVLPFYLAQRDAASTLWESWEVDDELDERFVRTLQMKPRRTASGVATITVLTKPWPCANRCVYCPDDERMPKSYLSDEPACQRAERNQFHPYRQVASRLRTLQQMGHATDKVELIILGGTWLDYPPDYRIWFIEELFRALNDGLDPIASGACEAEGAFTQLDGDATGASPRLREMEPQRPRSTLDSLREQHRANERASHRVVGLVVETRPDTVTCDSLTHLRELGCTKVQLGVQSIDAGILKLNGRRETLDDLVRAFELCRLFGFKIHAHFMVNLLGATPETDVRDYRTFANDARFQPDEVKLYPCALVASAPLVASFESGAWRPYGEGELLDTLGANLLDTPPYTRISRMIRDISAADILVGNKKTNLRQLVEERARRTGRPVREIRFREIGTEAVNLGKLSLDEIAYETTATTEHFLQWVDPCGRIAGFARLSLPHADALARQGGRLPIEPGEAMIREVHVYGFATELNAQGVSAQHRGLGRALVERACEIARAAGYARLNVISAVGTREYYRALGFGDGPLYQRKSLVRPDEQAQDTLLDPKACI